ncbi:MAG TPA: hypothetical protein VHP12_01160 [Chitinophagaceae bacterium]|nr:hypothetical protein [Chitinophagaceae bacterium]
MLYIKAVAISNAAPAFKIIISLLKNLCRFQLQDAYPVFPNYFHSDAA